MYFDQNSLYHFGIFGMKWGVRRYQNEDGTLTEEGKKRYLRTTKDDKGNDISGISDVADKEFFKNKTSRLTKEGEELLKDTKNDSDLRKAVETIKFERGYGENWLNSYNKAADVFNSKINDINTKFSDNPSESEKIYREYIKEVNDMWQKAYGDILLKDFGEHPNIGKEWLKYAFAYSQYEDADNLIDEDMRRKWATQKTSKTLSQRFDAAQKDNPKLTYAQIYKEMKVDMNSDDPDVYKEAEAAWFKKHGY